MRNAQRCCVAVCMIGLCAMTAVVEGQVRYTMLSLGGLVEGQYSNAFGINELGQVVGSAAIGVNDVRAFRTAPNQPIDSESDNLGTLGGGLSIGYGINDLGQVVGQSWLSDATYGISRGFRTAPNAPINPATDNLGTLGGKFSLAHAINNQGQVVGYANTPGDLEAHAYRTQGNAPINPNTDDLGVDGSTYSYAYGINESGQVVGHTGSGAFRTAPNAPLDPNSDLLGQGTFQGMNAINNAGQVAGDFRFEVGGKTYYHAFLTTPTGKVDQNADLGTLGGPNRYAYAVNDYGVAVGHSELATSAEFHAFVFSGSQLHDLNDLVDNLDGWTLSEAHDINNKGQIVGYAKRNGVGQAYLLTPLFSFVTGDVDGDGSVNLTDFGILRQHMGLPGVRADGDLSGDGRIDISDFGILKDNFGRSAAVPEPTGLIGLLMGAVIELTRRLICKSSYGRTPGRGAAACGFASW